MVKRPFGGNIKLTLTFDGWMFMTTFNILAKPAVAIQVLTDNGF